MVELSIDNGDLRVEVLGWSRVWAFRRRLRFPLSDVRSVRSDAGLAKGWWKGWRLPGTHVPGLLVAGTYLRQSGREFWDVRGGRQSVIIELERGPYRRLIVDVADAPAAVSMIRDALARRAA